jgi:hypothetical protein
MPSPAKVPGPADRRERVVPRAAEAAREQGVVPHLRVRVEREVVRGEADVVLQERPQPLREHG